MGRDPMQIYGCAPIHKCIYRVAIGLVPCYSEHARPILFWLKLHLLIRPRARPFLRAPRVTEAHQTKSVPTHGRLHALVDTDISDVTDAVTMATD